MAREESSRTVSDAQVPAAVPRALAWAFLNPPRRIHWNTPRTALGAPYERVKLRTRDDVPLSAWFVPHPHPRGIAVLSHGYASCRETMFPYLKMLRDAGFSALLYDFRAHGWSGGKGISFGLNEREDLRAAIEAAVERGRGLPLVLVGESMGAAVSLMVAADDPRVRAVLADCPFARLDDPIACRLKTIFGDALGERLHLPTRDRGAQLIGAPPETIAPEESVARIVPRPLMVVHGEADQLIPVSHAHRLQRAAGGALRLWTVPKAVHARSVHTQPEEYARRVQAFLEDVLRKESGPDA